MSRIYIDLAELTALSALCRNASYDVAGIATEAQYRADQLNSFLGVEDPAAAARIAALVNEAVVSLHRAAALLEDDALAVASIGQRGADADALGGMAGTEHDLISRFDTSGEDTP